MAKQTDGTLQGGSTDSIFPGGPAPSPTDGTPPEQTLAEKVDAAANETDATSTANVPGQGVPPLAVEPVGSQAADVVGEEPGGDWVQLVFRGQSGTGLPPTTASTDQQIDQNDGPTGKSYHFRQNVVTLVHPDDVQHYLDKQTLRFERPAADETVS